MPRALGQIDARKSEAIITAAFAVLAERGLSAPLEEVARRANVSKQTVYNHYGSKAQLLQALELKRTVFRSDHASNWLVLKGVLGAEKERLLLEVRNAIGRPASARLRADWQRGL